MTVIAPSSRVRRHVHPEHNDPATWLRRGEVGKLLGIPRTSVRYLETNGALHPLRDERGDYLYDPDEVNAYAVSNPRRGAKIYDDGDLTCEAAKLFELGKTRNEVVVALRITYARADALWEEWHCGDFEAAAKRRRARAAAETLDKLQTAADRKRNAARERTLALMRSMARNPSPR